MSADLVKALTAALETQRRQIQALREAGDALWYCVRHNAAVSPEERADAVEEWQEARDNL